MAKRFTDILIWDDDWFGELPQEYKLFWFYIKDTCDHAGIWKPKTRAFKISTNIDIDLEKALSLFNNGKNRIRIVRDGYWLIEDFFFFQYVKTARCMNLGNKVHKSAFNIYIKMGVHISSIKGIDFIKDERGDTHDVDEYEHSVYNFDLNLTST